MEFRTLKQCTLTEITEVFNHAFSDYIVPLKMTEAAMAEKIKTENILPRLSAGAFDNNKLVGFVLHGYDELKGVKTVYNAGTGVIPSHRGGALTEKIYNFIIPELQKQGINHHVLEVISTNKPAIRVYEKLGFISQRELGVFKKTGQIVAGNDLEIKTSELDGSWPVNFFSCEPSWQNSTNSIFRNTGGHQFIAAFKENEVIGYAVYVQSTGRVKQLAVHPGHRRKGVGTALVSYMTKNKAGDALVFTNIDLNYLPGVQFFLSLGFEKALTQFEMKLST